MNDADDDDDMLPEYDLSNAVQGKHSREYWATEGLVAIAPDLRANFPTADAVNEALRLPLSIKQLQLVGAA